MEQIEEFLYQAFCAAVFCLALSLFFQMTERYSDLLEGGRGLLEAILLSRQERRPDRRRR